MEWEGLRLLKTLAPDVADLIGPKCHYSVSKIKQVALAYVSLERLFALHAEQPIFRKGWRTDLSYFFLNTLLIQVTSLLTLQPAMIFFDWARHPKLVDVVATLPLPIQIVCVLLVADFTQYWVHRAFHSIPFLARPLLEAESVPFVFGGRVLFTLRTLHDVVPHALLVRDRGRHAT